MRRSRASTATGNEGEADASGAGTRSLAAGCCTETSAVRTAGAKWSSFIVLPRSIAAFQQDAGELKMKTPVQFLLNGVFVGTISVSTTV